MSSFFWSPKTLNMGADTRHFSELQRVESPKTLNMGADTRHFGE